MGAFIGLLLVGRHTCDSDEASSTRDGMNDISKIYLTFNPTLSFSMFQARLMACFSIELMWPIMAKVEIRV